MEMFNPGFIRLLISKAQNFKNGTGENEWETPNFQNQHIIIMASHGPQRAVTPDDNINRFSHSGKWQLTTKINLQQTTVIRTQKGLGWFGCSGSEPDTEATFSLEEVRNKSNTNYFLNQTVLRISRVTWQQYTNNTAWLQALCVLYRSHKPPRDKNDAILPKNLI